MGASKTPLSIDMFRKENRQTGPQTCKVSLFVKTMTVAEQKATFEAFDDSLISVSAIWRVLKDRGYTGGRESVARTRSGCIYCDTLKASLKKGASR